MSDKQFQLLLNKLSKANSNYKYLLRKAEAQVM